jgi:hypothetical protein
MTTAAVEEDVSQRIVVTLTGTVRTRGPQQQWRYMYPKGL